jgi:hypothetical protein
MCKARGQMISHLNKDQIVIGQRSDLQDDIEEISFYIFINESFVTFLLYRWRIVITVSYLKMHFPLKGDSDDGF